jgi:sulfur carrier protein
MIDVFINGECKAIDEQKTLAVVLNENGFNYSCVAVAINSEFVPRADYEKTFLRCEDAIDVVLPVQGG